MKKVLTIAGSDCSGGAGIQADIKTITVHGMYAMSAITALTAQNTTGVYGIQEATPAFVAQQLDCIFTDIRPDAVKIGMVSSGKVIEAIAQKLREYRAEHIVLDPVMVATSGSRLLETDAVKALVACLMPLAEIVTPNLPEAQALCGFEIHSGEEAIQAAEKIGQMGPEYVLVKGGHQKDRADDLLWHQGESQWFLGEKIPNPNTHGTGCTLSSAIACGLAAGLSVPESVAKAKEYLTGALSAGLDLGQGSGPLNHCYMLSHSEK